MKLKNTLQINYKNLEDLYIFLQYKITKVNNYKLSYFSTYMHKKLNYFLFFFNNKFYNYSNGQLLKKKSKKLKFFKKSKKSFGFTLNLLNKKLNKRLNSIFFFYCKNFNFKNYSWIKKFFYLIKPNIYFSLITNSWNNITKNKRRIKKKIFRNLFKSINLV